jgi:hypothetical protein
MPRWRADLALQLAVHAAIQIQPAQLLPQIAGLQQDLRLQLGHDPRLHAWAQAYLAEAWAAVTTDPVDYTTARYAAASGASLAPPTAAARDLLRARWQTTTVVEALTVCIWIVCQYCAIHRRRHGIVPSPHAAGFALRRG